MKITIKCVFMLLQVLIHSGCATTGVNKKYVANISNETRTGTIIVAYAKHGHWKNMLSAMVHFRSTDGKIEGAVESPNFFMRYLLTGERLSIPIPSDLFISPDNPQGGVQAIELPAGEYEFYRYSAHNTTPLPTGTVTYRLESKRPFSAKFTVKPESATYVGRLEFKYFANNRVAFRIIDRSNEDIAVFKRNYVEFAKEAISIEVPRMK